MQIVRIIDTPKAVICQIKNGHLGDRDESIEQAIAAAVQFHKRLVIDLRFVLFMNSRLITDLVMLQKTALGCSLPLAFTGVSPNLLEVLSVTKLDKVFRIIDNLDDEDIPPQASAVPKRPRPSGDSGYAGN